MWRVCSRYVGGVKRYRVYRPKDPLLPDHNRNRIYHGEYYVSRYLAQYVANELNREEADRDGE